MEIKNAKFIPMDQQQSEDRIHRVNETVTAEVVRCHLKGGNHAMAARTVELTLRTRASALALALFCARYAMPVFVKEGSLEQAEGYLADVERWLSTDNEEERNLLLLRCHDSWSKMAWTAHYMNQRHNGQVGICPASHAAYCIAATCLAVVDGFPAQVATRAFFYCHAAYERDDKTLEVLLAKFDMIVKENHKTW